MSKKKSKNKKKFTKVEFIFNLISLILMIGIGIYYGGRSIYYYSKQNIKIKEEQQTLNGYIVQNQQVKHDQEDGLHQDNDGYYFKGNVENNYVMFANQIFRIIRINKDNSVKLITDDITASFMWGDQNKYELSNVRAWLTKTEDERSGVYYDLIPSVEEFLQPTKYDEEILKNNKVTKKGKQKQDYITTLSIHDYFLANGKNSYLNNNKLFYILGTDENEENLYIDEDGTILSIDQTEGYGIRAVITLKPNTIISSGIGTKDAPFIIDQKDNVNTINSYIKINNDIWKIYYDKDGIIKLYLNDYLKVNNELILKPYSNTNSIFNIQDKKNIAYFLNKEYYESLSYKNIILDSTYLTGEISTDIGYSYYNIYNNQITCKIGLLNIYDYFSNNTYSFYRINTTSYVGSIQYSNYQNGLLEEVDVRELRPIIPTISISKELINNGKGTIDEPFIVEA